jgi:hypothetical protein
VTAEVEGYGHPDATPTLWEVALDQVRSAETFWFSTGPQERKARNLASNGSCILTTGRPELADGSLDVVLEGVAEQVTDNSELQPIAEAFAAKYGTSAWDFVVHDGAFRQRVAGARALVFGVRPVRGLGFGKGRTSSQTTWRFPT